MKKQERVMPLVNGEILFDGVIYPGNVALKKDRFKVKEWFDFWESLIDEIKSSKMPYSDVSAIYDEFRKHIFRYGSHKKLKNKNQDIMQLSTKLNFSLIKAYNNYLQDKGKLWSFLFGYSADKILRNFKSEEMNKIIEK